MYYFQFFRSTEENSPDLTEESPRKPRRKTEKPKTNLSQRSKIPEKPKYLPIQILNKLSGKICTECQYVGSVRFDTIQHIKNVHLKTKLFQCNLCNFGCLKLRVLKKHFENSHLKSKSKTIGDKEHAAQDCHFGILDFDDPNEIVEVPLPPKHVPEIVNLEIDQPPPVGKQQRKPILENIQKKRQKNKNCKRNAHLKSQVSRRRNRNFNTADEFGKEKIKNLGKRKVVQNANEVTYPGDVKKSLKSQEKSDVSTKEQLVPEASKDCQQNNSKKMESNSQHTVSIIICKKCKTLKSTFLGIFFILNGREYSMKKNPTEILILAFFEVIAQPR